MLNNLNGGVGLNINSPTLYRDVLLTEDSLQDLINSIIRECDYFMNGAELQTLNKTLQNVLSEYEVVIEQHIRGAKKSVEENDVLIEKYIKTGIVEGKSSRTLKLYEHYMRVFLDFAQKPISEVTTQDVLDYLSLKQKEGNMSNYSLDNIRRYLSAMFRWFSEEEYIVKNPVDKISKIKSTKKVRQPFSTKDIELLRLEIHKKQTTGLRDVSIFELLLSSGIRIAELVDLNREDLNLDDCSMIVLGKGNRQRKAYFNVKTQTMLELYLESRFDDNPALFVASKKPHNRLTINAVERTLREYGEKLGIKVYPHRFRHTFATNLLNKGVPIEQVQKLLGHNNVNTTTIYAQVDDEQLSYKHKKLLS